MQGLPDAPPFPLDLQTAEEDRQKTCQTCKGVFTNSDKSAMKEQAMRENKVGRGLPHYLALSNRPIQGLPNSLGMCAF